MEPDEQDETLRRRIHRLADTVQGHGEKLHEHRIMHQHAKEQLDMLRDEKATRHELAAHQTLIAASIEGATARMAIQLTHVQEGQVTLQRAVNWVVALVLGAVLLAGMNLILRAAGHAGEPTNIESPAHVR